MNADTLTPESELRYAKILLETALRISVQLGYRPANPDMAIMTSLGQPFLGAASGTKREVPSAR